MKIQKRITKFGTQTQKKPLYDHECVNLNNIEQIDGIHLCAAVCPL